MRHPARHPYAEAASGAREVHSWPKARPSGKCWSSAFAWTPTELTVYNPLKAKVGSAATINTIEWRDFNFFITEIRE